jgi:hypothetical protein
MFGRTAEAEQIHMQVSHLRRVCEGLLLRIVQEARGSGKRGFVVLLTSPNQGAGVSRITNALADALNFVNDQSAITLDCRNMDFDRYGYGEPVRLEESQKRTGGVWRTDPDEDDIRQMQETLAGALNRFRQLHEYVLIDCPSLRETQDAIRLAPLVDGVIFVVEANRTQKDQLRYAERTIESAKGKIFGHILNKRPYVIPDWLSRRMDALGV